MPGPLEGPVSRYLNRRMSVPLAAVLARTPVTPNQVSIAACAMAVAAGALLGIGRTIEGAVLIQLSSVVDGADGDLARAKSMASPFGGLFDAVLDRYADAAIAGGMAWYAFQHEDMRAALIVGFAATVAFLLVPYSRARLETEGGGEGASLLPGLATRDVRLAALAVGAAVGQCWWALVVVGALSYATVGWRMLAFRRRPDVA